MEAVLVVDQQREELVIQKLLQLIENKEGREPKPADQVLEPHELKPVFGYPANMIVLSQANKIISRLECLSHIPTSYITSISNFLATHLPAVRGADCNATIIESFSKVALNSLVKGEDYSRLPWHKVLEKYAKKIIKPSKKYKRSLALKVLKDAGCNELLSSIVDKQTWDDLEIFKGEKSLAQNICRAETELGKVFFWRHIASPTTE
ncbi:MAG: hypothetical protein H0U27_01550, partial [Nitrosopumilus sp.]|nr:hypothetical protein [Nitrosopumilus sp.]